MEIPVLIVGGGPVGLTLSIELSRHGVRHLLLTEGLETSTHPKCNTTNARSMEHFRRLGLAPSIRFGGLPADYPTDIVYLTRLSGREIARIRFPSPKQAAGGTDPAGAPTPEPQHRISQIFLEKILRERAESEASADIRFGWQVTALKQVEGGVRVTARHLPSGAIETIMAAHVVGADGGRSTIRRLADIKYTGTARMQRDIFGGTMIATYYESHELGAHLGQNPGFMYWTLNADFRSVTVAIDGESRFLTHFQIPHGVDADDVDVDAYLRAAFGKDYRYDVLSSAHWNAGFRLVAERFQKGDVLIAGDAAHLFTPTGGFGMNTGIDDVANLGWKIAAVVNGWGGKKLLESYDAERRPIADRNTQAASEIADVIAGLQVPADIEDAGAAGDAARRHVADLLGGIATEEFLTAGVQLGVRYEGSPIIVADGTPPTPDSRTRYVPTARPGSRLPHLALDDGVSVFDRLGMGFTLLRVGTTADSGEALVVAAKKRGVPMTVFDIEHPQAHALYGAGLLLVRPDQHVAWRGDTVPDDADQLIATITGAGA